MSCLAVALGSEKAPTTSGKISSAEAGGVSCVPALETERSEPVILERSHHGKLRPCQREGKQRHCTAVS